MIDSFDGQYRFLSNFYPHKFRWRGATYKTAEHAYQAAKCVHRADVILIKQADTPGLAKRLGRGVVTLENWDLIKVGIMRSILIDKFADPKLRLALMMTHPQKLVEGNHWNDTFWGVCNGRGHNQLGKLLMEIRSDARRANQPEA